MSLCAFGLEMIKSPIKLLEIYHCDKSVETPAPHMQAWVRVCGSQSLVKQPQDIRDHRTSFRAAVPPL